ncbi:hypothetical protein BMW23_0689 [Bodo saltans virus]|uniref:Uncharacterized protein n=1 Tax=Bodo saltans virus TaxID=2024608 RepID=A0A2H4UV71_9VIRU|nr:hypothetical protein QJ851_gp0672 [Bodo saltans virus]ATZ80735.1 hypothetical protein BMW23_0689 [Bodo saltans virus]
MESINPLAELTYMKGGFDNMTQTINIIILVLILAIIYFVYRFYQEYKNGLNNPVVQILNEQQSIPEIPEQKIKININNDNDNNNNNNNNRLNPLREYDYRALYDPLVAPRRRDDSNLPVLPLPTRGYPIAFKKMGILIDKTAPNDDKYKILLLMGRTIYPNSNSYEYYVTENTPHSAIKFDINKTRELQTDDTVNVKELNKDYTVIMDKMLGYSYDPYIY